MIALYETLTLAFFFAQKFIVVSKIFTKLFRCFLDSPAMLRWNTSTLEDRKHAEKINMQMSDFIQINLLIMILSKRAALPQDATVLNLVSKSVCRYRLTTFFSSNSAPWPSG